MKGMENFKKMERFGGRINFIEASETEAFPDRVIR
jgi:hypothetical protein